MPLKIGSGRLTLLVIFPLIFKSRLSMMRNKALIALQSLFSVVKLITKIHAQINRFIGF